MREKWWMRRETLNFAAKRSTGNCYALLLLLLLLLLHEHEYKYLKKRKQKNKKKNSLNLDFILPFVFFLFSFIFRKLFFFSYSVFLAAFALAPESWRVRLSADVYFPAADVAFLALRQPWLHRWRSHGFTADVSGDDVPPRLSLIPCVFLATSDNSWHVASMPFVSFEVFTKDRPPIFLLCFFIYFQK